MKQFIRLSETQHGLILKCYTCNKIHLEYNNIYIDFEEEGFYQFCQYFNDLNPTFWEEVNRKSILRRRIIVPVGHQSIHLLFNSQEVEELKLLLNYAYSSIKKVNKTNSPNVYNFYHN
ncbi:MAG: hypothetical protein N2662_12685 [Bacteroidales bacterium]|nr:hypothetical protein [Bacteroidales bacterium]